MFHIVLLNQKDLNGMYVKKSKEKTEGGSKKPNILLPAQFFYVYHTAFERIVSSLFPEFIPKIIY